MVSDLALQGVVEVKIKPSRKQDLDFVSYHHEIEIVSVDYHGNKHYMRLNLFTKGGEQQFVGDLLPLSKEEEEKKGE